MSALFNQGHLETQLTKYDLMLSYLNGLYEPAREILVLITYASSEASDETAYQRSLV